ncbi:hypothetical protein WME89_28735 [Sorangium sp. So ce321]|uniref:hypothetical protein n=1 Tax=Sorangium sp. So ce321 TaxID=3133300 RepID=UPI003F5F9320
MKHVKRMAFALLGTLAAAGCASEPSVPGEAAPSEPACLEAITEHRALEGCGVFARAPRSGEFIGGSGTMADPALTLGHAIELARTGRRRVFACGGWSFGEDVVLPSGIDLVGGFDCRNGWNYDEGTPAFLLTPDKGGPVSISVVPDDGERQGLDDGVSTITDLLLWIVNATRDGASTVGIVVHPNAALELVRGHIETIGAAHRGFDADRNMPDQPDRARDGTDGSPGGDACSADIVPGGAAVSTIYDDGSMSVGGKGGDGRADRGDDGSSGAPLPSPNPSGAGLGGAGATSQGPCEAGQFGARGVDGAHGRGGRRAGTFTATGWVGEAGTDGGDGTPGAGGGGGGGARGGTLACSVPPNGGRSGGSGGGGGFGAKGGRGGGYGGGSIGIIAFDARVTLRDVHIQTHNGGDGGYGQRGQEGGHGGRPGEAAEARGQGSALRACDGGLGGRGGHGGNGGAGAGGPSVGIAYVNEELLTLENVTFQIGAPGEGGYTSGADSTLEGENGFASEMVRFSP